MRFSLRLNNDLPLSEYVVLAQAAEAAGFHQIWISNDLFLRSAPVILAAVAQATHRIQVGTGILNPYTIHPAELAMLAATLDELSGRRFNLGLAAGAQEFLAWAGVERDRPLAVIRDTLVRLRRLLSGESAGGPGALGRWHPQAYLRFPPPRTTPLYLGATGPRMLALAGELADGVLPLLFPPEHYAEVRAQVARGELRRDPGLAPLDFAACFWVSVAPDPDAARRALALKVAYYGPALGPWLLRRLGLEPQDLAPIERALHVEKDPDRAAGLVDERMLRVGIAGTPAQVIARLEPIVAAGATHLSFGPPLGPDPRAAVELLGEVIRHFQGPSSPEPM